MCGEEFIAGMAMLFCGRCVRRRQLPGSGKRRTKWRDSLVNYLERDYEIINENGRVEWASQMILRYRKDTTPRGI